jgi:DNA polymerase III subunit epsilon
MSNDSKPIPDLVWADCETSHLNESQGEILEIAVVRTDARTLEEKGFLHKYIFPSMPLDPKAIEINGYSYEKWKSCGAVPAFGSIVNDLNQLLVDATPAGQNPGFDVRFIKEAYRREGTEMPRMDYHIVDLAVLAWPMQLAGLVPSVSLRYTAPFFGLGEQTHTALEDIRQTIAAYKRLVGFYVDRLMSEKLHMEREGRPFGAR